MFQNDSTPVCTVYEPIGKTYFGMEMHKQHVH